MALPTRSLVGQVLDLVGITGAGAPANSLSPRSPTTPGAAAQMAKDFNEDSRIANPDVWSYYNSSLKQPGSFEDMLRVWDDMSTWDLLAAALVEIVDEAIQPDSTSPGTLWYECNDAAQEDKLNSMLERLDVETLLPSQVWYVAAFGNHFEKLLYAPGDGVLGLSFAHPMDVRRFWLAKNRRCVGFRWAGHTPNKEDTYEVNGTKVERNGIQAGSDKTEDLWYPWDFLHFRRMYRLRISEHGEPIFSEASGIYKKLRMALDQMVVHRAQVQPDRYVVNVDVQEQPPVEQMRTVQRWKQSLRSKLAFGQGQGDGSTPGQPTDFKSYYNALSLDTIFWMAKPKGFTHSIEKMAGTANVPDVYDVELLISLFFSIIGMPKSWIGIGKEDGGPTSGKALLAQDLRFYRKVKGIRRPIQQGYAWLAYFDCVLRGVDISNLDITAKMTEIGSLEDQMKLDMLDKQVDILAKLGDVIDKFDLPKEAWLELVFKKYMHLPDDLINAFMTALPPEAEQKLESRGGSVNVPRQNLLLRQIEETLKAKGALHEVGQLKGIVAALGHGVPVHPRRLREGYRRWINSDQKVPVVPAHLKSHQIMEGDVIVNSFDTSHSLRRDIQESVAKVEGGNLLRRWSPVPGPING